LTDKYLRGVVVDEVINGYHYDWPAKEKNLTFHHDHLNSVTAVTGHDGTTVETASYGPFGNMISETGPALNGGEVANKLRYTGREFDRETGLYYYRARYYDPELGRFYTEDPLRFRAGINFYAYVNNNPLNANDPTGLFFEEIGEWFDTKLAEIADAITYEGPTYDDSESSSIYATPQQRFEFMEAQQAALNRPNEAPSNFFQSAGYQVDEFGNGALSYFDGLYEAGRYGARRWGAFGELEQTRATTEDLVFIEITKQIANNPGAALDLISNYIQDNPGRVAGRGVMGASIAMASPKSIAIPLTGIAAYGNARRAIEDGLRDWRNLVPAVVGGESYFRK